MVGSFAKASLVTLAWSMSTLAQNSSPTNSSTSTSYASSTSYESREPEPETSTTDDPSFGHTVQCSAPVNINIPVTYSLSVTRYHCLRDCPSAEYGQAAYSRCCSNCHSLLDEAAGKMTICEGCNKEGTKGGNCSSTRCGTTSEAIVDYALGHVVNAKRRLLEMDPVEMVPDSRALQSQYNFNASCQTGIRSAEKLLSPVLIVFNCSPCTELGALALVRPCCNKCGEVRDAEESNSTDGFKRFVQCTGCYGYPGLEPAHPARDFKQLISDFIRNSLSDIHGGNDQDTSNGVSRAMANAFAMLTIAVYAL